MIQLCTHKINLYKIIWCNLNNPKEKRKKKLDVILSQFIFSIQFSIHCAWKHKESKWDCVRVYVHMCVFLCLCISLISLLSAFVDFFCGWLLLKCFLFSQFHAGIFSLWNYRKIKIRRENIVEKISKNCDIFIQQIFHCYSSMPFDHLVFNSLPKGSARNFSS